MGERAIYPGIRFGYALEEGVEGLFYCWVREVVRGGERFRRDVPWRYWRVSWDEDAYTEFREARLVRPPGLNTLSLRSRAVFRYGVFQLLARLPRWSGGPMLWFGFEAEDLFGGGVVHFMFRDGELRAFAGAWGAEPLSMRLPGLPGDYHSRRHTYTVKVHSGLALWFIDSSLRGVAVLVDSGDPVVVWEGPPYSVGITPVRPASSLGVLIDIDGGPVDREWVWDDIHPWQVRVMEGDPRPSLAVKLHRYGSEEHLEGAEVGEPMIAHPLPAMGARPTIVFKASVSGVVRFEALTLAGSWEEIDEVELKAGEPLYYEVGVSAPFIRLAFEPRGSGRIKVAEAYVS